jgi:hypothetical protein
VHRDGQISKLEAEARARRQAEEELARALADREELRSLVEQTQQRLAEAEARFAAEMSRARKVKPIQRDAFIARAQQAAGEPLTEAEVRQRVDEMLRLAGWDVQDGKAANLFAADGVAVREVATAKGVADYLLYVDRKLVGVIEAKREGKILSPVEAQSARYAGTLTASQQFAAWRIPLPFRYETTAVETHFTNTLDPAPRARSVFSFHRPETLARWMRDAGATPEAPTLRARLNRLPVLDIRGLRAAFDKKPARPDAPWTSTLWVYDFRTGQHFMLKQNRLTHEHLDDFVKCYRPGEPRDTRIETEHFKPYSYDDLIARDKGNLDITWLKDPSLEDADSLLPPDVIAREIIEDLTAALAEFTTIAEALEQTKNRPSTE